MVRLYGERYESAVADSFWQVGGTIQLAYGLFDRHFPDTCRADVDVGVVIEAVPEFVGQRGITLYPPQDDVRIEQQAHGNIPKSRAISSFVSAESHSGPSVSWPRREPYPVRLTRRTSGTTLATGWPARLMTISSPCSTRSIMRDSC